MLDPMLAVLYSPTVTWRLRLTRRLQVLKRRLQWLLRRKP